MLRSFIVSCRLCGTCKSYRVSGNSVFFGRSRFPEDGRSLERRYSEKSRDPKNFRWVTGRPDDPPKKNRPQMTGRPEITCRIGEHHQAAKQESKAHMPKASDVKNPEKWTGRPDSICDVNRKNPSYGATKDRPKDGDKPQKSPKGGKRHFSAPKESKTITSTGMSSVHVKNPKQQQHPPLSVTSSVLEEVRSLSKRSPPCLEAAEIPKDTHIQGSASVFATQFNVAHQGMPELVSGCGRCMEFPDELTPALPKPSKDPATLFDKANLDSLKDINHSTIETLKLSSNEKLYTTPAIEKSSSALKTHILKPEKRPKENQGKRIDIKISKLPPPKIVRETFNEVNRHRVYSFGLAETGALGFHKPNEGRRWRKCMPRPLRHQFAEENRVISAESGYGFTLFYVKSDSTIKLYGCGLNTDFQLGPTDDEVVTYPSPIDLRISSPKTKIMSLSAGRAHSVVATDKEGVFLFGSNSYGQCGRAVEEDDAGTGCTITQIKGFGGERVASVTCGQDHSCFVTESGKVYACGWGSEGQTGQGHCLHVAEPCLVTGDIGSEEKIVKVSGKCDTVLALSDKGNLFGWGSNEFKQLLDDPDISQVDRPVALEGVHRKCGKIIDVAAGSSFCLALNQEGDVYVWGYGILGTGPELVKTSVPTLLPRTLFGANDYHPLTVPSKVFCGVDHMAVVNNLKHVYAWGKNKHGCLGIGNSRDQYFPYKLAISADAIHVSCAVDHSVVVTDHE